MTTGGYFPFYIRVHILLVQRLIGLTSELWQFNSTQCAVHGDIMTKQIFMYEYTLPPHLKSAFCSVINLNRAWFNFVQYCGHCSSFLFSWSRAFHQLSRMLLYQISRSIRFIMQLSRIFWYQISWSIHFISCLWCSGTKSADLFIHQDVCSSHVGLAHMNYQHTVQQEYQASLLAAE